MLIVTISGGRAQGKSTLMRSVSALLLKMVPGLRVYTMEGDDHRPRTRFEEIKEAPHILFQTVDSSAVEPKTLEVAIKLAKRIRDNMLNKAEPWTYELTDEQREKLNTFASDVEKRRSWLRGDWSKGVDTETYSRAGFPGQYEKEPPFLDADYAIIEARALAWATETNTIKGKAVIDEWASKELSPGVRNTLMRSLSERDNWAKKPHDDLPSRMFNRNEASVRYGGKLVNNIIQGRSTSNLHRVWKQFSLAGLPIWLELPYPLPDDLPAHPSTCDVLPIWTGSVPYAGDDHGYGYSSDGPPPMDAMWIDCSDGRGPVLNPNMKVNHLTGEIDAHILASIAAKKEIQVAVTEGMFCSACNSRTVHDKDCPVGAMKGLADQANAAMERYKPRDADLGKDQATDDAIVREHEADESYAEHEVEAGRAKRIWKTYQMYVDSESGCLNAMKEYSADGQGSALHQQWAEVLKDAEIGAFFITYEIVDLTAPGTLWKALIRDFTRANNPPPHLVNHTWKSDIPSGAYRHPAPDTEFKGVRYVQQEGFGVVAGAQGSETILPKRLADTLRAPEQIQLQTLIDQMPKYADDTVNVVYKMAHAIQMFRNEAQLGRSSKLRATQGYSMLVNAWDEFIDYFPDARLSGKEINIARHKKKG